MSLCGGVGSGQARVSGGRLFRLSCSSLPPQRISCDLQKRDIHCLRGFYPVCWHLKDRQCRWRVGMTAETPTPRLQWENMSVSGRFGAPQDGRAAVLAVFVSWWERGMVVVERGSKAIARFCPTCEIQDIWRTFRGERCHVSQADKSTMYFSCYFRCFFKAV